MEIQVSAQRMYQNLMTILLFGYDQVIAYNGYINFHKGATELNVLVAQGDIGQNELTGISKAYSLGSVAVPTIDGTCYFLQTSKWTSVGTTKTLQLVDHIQATFT
jgi:hypothetical protein